MRLVEDYKRECTTTSKYPYWWSLMKCDDCGKEWCILRKNFKKLGELHYCKGCCQKGERNYWHRSTGRKNPKRVRENSSEWMKSMRKDPVFNEKGRKARIGLKLSEKTKQNLREKFSGKGNPQYGKRGVLSPNFGKKGILCANYNPELTDHDRRNNRKSEVYSWSNLVKERDNFTCQISGQKGGKLISHHLDGWNKFPEKRFEVSNGVTISKQFHDLFHKIYGRGDNTKEQFEEFLTYAKGNENSYIEF